MNTLYFGEEVPHLRRPCRFRGHKNRLDHPGSGPRPRGCDEDKRRYRGPFAKRYERDGGGKALPLHGDHRGERGLLSLSRGLVDLSDHGRRCRSEGCQIGYDFARPLPLRRGGPSDREARRGHRRAPPEHLSHKERSRRGHIRGGLATVMAIILVFALSLRLRPREMETIFELGCRRATTARLIGAKILIIVAASGLLCGVMMVTVNQFAHSLVRALFIR